MAEFLFADYRSISDKDFIIPMLSIRDPRFSYLFFPRFQEIKGNQGVEIKGSASLIFN